MTSPLYPFSLDDLRFALLEIDHLAVQPYGSSSLPELLRTAVLLAAPQVAAQAFLSYADELAGTEPPGDLADMDTWSRWRFADQLRCKASDLVNWEDAHPVRNVG